MSPVPCDVCGEPVERTSPTQKRHVGECHREHERRRRNSGYREGRHARPAPGGPWRGECVCRYCERAFGALSPRASVCPSDECQRRRSSDRARAFREGYRQRTGAVYETGRFAEQRRAHRKARRARQANAPEVEVFTSAEVFERDGWKCSLCGDPIDPALTFPDRWSASLDHVLPLSVGGAHTRANVRAAHLTCNTSKGARVEA